MKEFRGRLELARTTQHRPEAAGFSRDPKQQQQTNGEHERRADAFKKFDGLDSFPDHENIQRPKSEEADPDAALDVLRRGPEDLEHGIDCLSADPRLDSEPTASH